MNQSSDPHWWVSSQKEEIRREASPEETRRRQPGRRQPPASPKEKSSKASNLSTPATQDNENSIISRTSMHIAVLKDYPQQVLGDHSPRDWMWSFCILNYLSWAICHILKSLGDALSKVDLPFSVLSVLSDFLVPSPHFQNAHVLETKRQECQ